MYTLDYLNCFIENLDLPEASRASLRENCETLVTTPGAIDELVSAETLLFKDYGIDGAYGAEWKPIVPHMDALSERTGLHRHVVDFLFLALASERLRENYRAAGLTDELFWDTIADLKFKLIECHDVYDIWAHSSQAGTRGSTRCIALSWAVCSMRPYTSPATRS